MFFLQLDRSLDFNLDRTFVPNFNCQTFGDRKFPWEWGGMLLTGLILTSSASWVRPKWKQQKRNDNTVRNIETDKVINAVSRGLMHLCHWKLFWSVPYHQVTTSAFPPGPKNDTQKIAKWAVLTIYKGLSSVYDTKDSSQCCVLHASKTSMRQENYGLQWVI